MLRLGLLGLITVSVLSARVVRVEVNDQTAYRLGDDELGAHSQVAGTLHFAIDPKNPANRIVTDIDYAPLNKDGEVEFSADFVLIQPADMSQSNGSLLIDILNRGGKLANRLFDGTADGDDGFLVRKGFSVLWVGWQHDLPQDARRMRIRIPAATAAARPITGLVRSTFSSPKRLERQSLGDEGNTPYLVSDRNDPRNQLAVYEPDGPRTILRAWNFHNDYTITLKGGFAPNRLYEFVYVSKDPPLVGLGPAAIRDAAAYFKYNPHPSLGVTAKTYDRVIGFGASQSGRFLRGFLYDGFNRDEEDRIVLDGVMAHIAGATHGGFNHRFAQPSRGSSYPLNPGFRFPFADDEQTDPDTGRRDGILARLSAEHRPKIIYTNTSNEYWRSGASLTHTVLSGERDLDLPANVRSYYIAGTQHGPGSMPPRKTTSQQLNNPMAYHWPLRALLLALDDWVSSGKEPPASVYPRIDRKELVTREKLDFPLIPGVTVPAEPRPMRVLDFGPEFSHGIISYEPPKAGPRRKLLVPAVDDDGNETSGIQLPDLRIPLGTYTGWNLYDPAHGMPDQINLTGSYIPFAVTEAQRRRAGDSRRSLEVRYQGRADYLERITEAARALAEEGFVLAEDVPSIITSSRERWDYAHRR